MVQSTAVARLAVSWIVALALLLQIALSAIVPAIGMGPLDPLAAAEICHVGDSSTPADSTDRVAVRFKCIACVIATSLPPPALAAASTPFQTWIWRSQIWPLLAAAPRSRPAASHSPRGPPAIA
ncbi:MAG: hypothetical protein HZA66_13540 [Rhodopseudomonas palustris]|uniref:DUF2946 domain-containing protein n=1 Tax=Rhodopseudomonas palustris TaxID=1076 RepID=A0A933W1X8_RHOPL|nr:hypothetical protein [Rhodopseudomonas palustris]